ncbi:MAG: acyl-CoA synthetase [Gammaproteobacteria bacterium]|nr:acyl-CoA synthetase [Gammaproteobacteria bacterium]
MAAHWFDQKERGSALLLRVMRAVALAAGHRAASLLLWPITLYYYVTAGGGRVALAHFYQALGQPATTRVLFRHYLTFAHTILDRVYLLARRADAPSLHVRGFEAVQECLDRGQGCVLLGAHLGSFEAARAAGLRHEGLKMQIIMEERVSRNLNRVLGALDPGAGDTTVGLGGPSALLRVRDTIAEGGLVGIMGDRITPTETGYVADFLGRSSLFPLAPLRLAASLRAPVFFFAALYRRSIAGLPYYEVVFEPLAVAAPEGPARRAWLQDLGARYVGCLQRYCRMAPNNWFNFYDFWSTHTLGCLRARASGKPVRGGDTGAVDRADVAERRRA